MLYYEDFSKLLSLTYHDRRLTDELTRLRGQVLTRRYIFRPIDAYTWLMGPGYAPRRVSVPRPPEGLYLIHEAICNAPKPIDGLEDLPRVKPNAVNQLVSHARKWVRERDPDLAELLDQVKVDGQGQVRYFPDECSGVIET